MEHHSLLHSLISRLPVPARVSQGPGNRRFPRHIVTFRWVGLLLGAMAGAVALLLQPWCAASARRRSGVLALALLTGDSILTG